MFVYVIVNSETLKIYIGQHGYGARRLSLRQYLQRKISAARHHESGGSHLYNAMRKYPPPVWSIHSLISEISSREECNYWERLLIKALNAQHPEVGYNLARGGCGGGHASSEETRIKLRAAAKARKPRTGWHHSDESKVKSRLAHLGRKLGPRGPQSEEIKQKISAAHRGKKRGPMSEAERLKRSLANKGKQNTLGHRLTSEHRAKIQKAMQGRIFTPEWRAKISKAKLGNLGGRIRWDREKGKQS
jgi:hypothetical protein